MAPRQRDACWEYAEVDGNRVICRFCSKLVNGGISRFKYHLSRIQGKGVSSCSKVSDRVRGILAMEEDGNRRLRVRLSTVTHHQPSSSEAVDLTLARDQPSSSGAVDLTLACDQPSSSGATSRGALVLSNEENAEKCTALFFFENEVEFSAAHSTTYEDMIDAIKKCGGGFEGPTPESLRDDACGWRK